MKRAHLAGLLLVAAASAGAAWLARPQPGTRPPMTVEIANSVTSFAHDHPEWALLRQPRQDAAAIRLNHARHLDPDAPGMQDVLRVLANDPDAHVRSVQTSEGEALSLSCASCHEPDESGAYMRPIRFDLHCLRCHEEQLVRVPTVTADGDEGGARVPHGDVAAVVQSIEHALATRAAFEASRFAPAPQPGEAEPSAPQRSRGRRSGGASSTDEVPAFATRDQALGWLAEERRRFLVRAHTACSYCHTGAELSTDDPSGVFTVAPPRIPSLWLPLATYSHKSHEMLACVACHVQAEISRDTADIMIPGIESCRQCHTPSAGAPNSCTVCHTYHERNPYLEGGTLDIDQFTGRAPVAPSATAAP